MVKKVSLGLAAALAFGLVWAWNSGMLAYVVYGPPVASGMGAKLLCSARFVSHYDTERAFDDLVQYSPLLESLSIEYDDAQRRVTTSLFGLSRRTARHLPGLGCAVDYPGYSQRDELLPRPSRRSGESWPLGADVGEPDAGLQALLQSMLQADNAAGLNTRALLLVHRGRVVAEAYGQGAGPATPLLGWSMSKSLMAVALGNLEYRRLLNLSSASPFPAWASDERSAIRIDHLLQMTDGLAFSEQYAPGDDATAMLFTVPSSAGYALDQPALHEPGARFNYSSGTANLLAFLHQTVLGSPQAAHEDLMAQLFEPLGMQNALFETDASGTFIASSYVYASARDWARLGLLMLNEGELNGHRLLAADWVRRATRPNDSSNERAYGYQWWLNSGDEALRFNALPAGTYFASGNRQQLLMVVPSEEAVIVRLGWTAGGYPVNENFGQILKALQ